MVEVFFEDVAENKVCAPEQPFFDLWFTKVVEEHNRVLGDVTLVFCSDQYLLEINKSYLQHDYYTDIITFDYTINDVVSGDLFISWDRVCDNAKDLSIDVFDELCRVCVHGLLHLIGYLDKSPEEILVMREKEDRALLLRDLSQNTL